MHANEFAIDTLHGRSRGEAQDEVGFVAEFTRDDARDELTGRLGSGSDDDVHEKKDRGLRARMECWEPKVERRKLGQG
jgi:hypothetical protein